MLRRLFILSLAATLLLGLLPIPTERMFVDPTVTSGDSDYVTGLKSDGSTQSYPQN